MSLIAAFLWNKSPRCSISTMVVNDENFQLVSKPERIYFAGKYPLFKRQATAAVRDFFQTMAELYKKHQCPIKVEFKIIHLAQDIPYLTPAKESEFVYALFCKELVRLNKKIKTLDIKPQLRQRLDGIALKHFKQGLQSMYLVSRKRSTNYEYHLWSVALHATNGTYAAKLYKVRTKLLQKMWDKQDGLSHS